MVWCSVFFVADIVLNEAEHCVELCICLVSSIAVIFVPYLAKSYFGKRNEENNKMEIIRSLEESEFDGFPEDE